MSEDPLVDVIRHQAAAVRAHIAANYISKSAVITFADHCVTKTNIAAVLDAEEAKWPREPFRHSPHQVIDSLRATLLGTSDD